MKPLLSISLTLATLLMCQGCDVSEENIPDAPDSGAYIDFAVAGEDDDSMTRATTTTLNINNFKVSAYAQDAYGTYHTLMDQVTVRRTGQNSWTYSPKVNWPGVPVDFFAVSPASVKVDNNAWSNHTINYSIGTGDRDLLVAVRMRAEQKSGPLKLNFRHALTRINISLQTDRRDVRIEVRNVTLHGAPDHGLFTFPTASTTPGTDPGEIFSQWETQSTTKSEADMTFFQSSADLPHTLSDKQWDCRGMPLRRRGKRRNRMAGQLHPPAAPLAHRPRLWPCGISARRYHPRLPLASRPLLPLYAYSIGLSRPSLTDVKNKKESTHSNTMIL